MKKKFLTFIFVIVAMLSCAFAFSACGGGNLPTSSSPVENSISFNTLTVDGTNVYGKVSNTTTEFSFINEVTVKGNATYIVDNDKDCGSPIYSKTVDLVIGDNTFYVLEMIGNNVKLYTVTIRRRPMYEVSFNTNGGISVEVQVIEEDSLATEPETTRTGYTFTGWDYDFATPITQTTKITASWSANKDTKYTVNYYLQNLDDDNYTLHESVELEGETGTTATADIKEYTRFTYNASKSVISGNINGDGNRVLSVYYTRDKYTISTARNNTKAGTVVGVGAYKYDKEVTLTATTYAGYTWLGWYEGENLICESEEFTFKAEKNVTYTATWSANTDTKYTVIYYWQNIEDDNYMPHETVEFEGTTDTPTAEVEIKEYTHFTYNASKSVISGNINGDGSQALSVYYTRNRYTLSINDSSVGAIANSGTYKYGIEDFSTTATPYLGYNFLGWYHGETLLSNDLTYTFTATQDVMAKFEVRPEMSNFDFTSTSTACSITDIKDKTVTKIIIPDCVTAISSGVFRGCSSLTEITLPFVGATKSATSDSHFGYIFGARNYSYNDDYVPTSLKKVTITSATSIGNYAFYKCSSLTSVVIPDSVTSIGNYAFSGCGSLMEITLPFVGATKDGTSNTHFGYIFGASSYSYNDDYVPTSLKKVTITSATSIGDYAFYGCDGLTSITIPDSVTSIGNSACYYCSSLTSVVIPDGVTSIGGYAFYHCSSLTSVVIPNSVTSIGYSAFSDCRSLTSVVIPDSVTSIGWCAFYGCSSLTSVVIGGSVTSIGDYAFYGCSSLTSVVIPDSVTSIGDCAFYNCSSLTIYCEPTSKPSGWYSDWNYSNCPVVWGYKG